MWEQPGDCFVLNNALGDARLRGLSRADDAMLQGLGRFMDTKALYKIPAYTGEPLVLGNSASNELAILAFMSHCVSALDYVADPVRLCQRVKILAQQHLPGPMSVALEQRLDVIIKKGRGATPVAGAGMAGAPSPTS